MLSSQLENNVFFFFSSFTSQFLSQTCLIIYQAKNNKKNIESKNIDLFIYKNQ